MDGVVGRLTLDLAGRVGDPEEFAERLVSVAAGPAGGMDGVVWRLSLRLGGGQGDGAGGVGHLHETGEHGVGMGLGGRRGAGRRLVRRFSETQRNDALGLNEILQGGEGGARGADGNIRRRPGEDRLTDDERPRDEEAGRESQGGDRLFCGGALDALCKLSTGRRGEENVQRFSNFPGHSRLVILSPISFACWNRCAATLTLFCRRSIL